MITTECRQCGVEVTATDDDELVGEMMRHFAERHPDYSPLD